jgi:hypothetical protein
MTSTHHVLQFMGLRAHPFEPEVGVDGKPIDPRLVTQTLDPRVDGRLTSYYFDIYEYDQRSSIKIVLQNRALNAFPHRKTLRPVLFLITGTGQSGRGSMVNLCLHEISLAHRTLAGAAITSTTLDENDVFVVASAFTTLDATANIRQIAEDFAREFYSVDDAVSDKLTDLISKRPLETARSTAPYKSLFQDMRARIPKTFQRPVALVLSGYDSFDFWPSIYDATEYLVDYIIVDTIRDTEARISLEHMIQTRKNVSLVSARALDRQKAEDFLDHRLNMERLSPSFKKSMVFASDSLDPLFEPGKGARQAQEILQPIGWVNATLRRAFSRKVKALSEIVEQHGAQRLGSMALNERQITRRDISLAREELNQGR